MSLPNNFPLSEQQISAIQDRLSGTIPYKGVGVAGPLRDLSKVFRAMQWLLQRYENWISQKNAADAKAQALRAYMASAEAVLAGYASGNWDGGTAAVQLLQNMPEIP